MAQLTTSTLSMDSTNPRRHSDPPNLWLTVLASSVTLHLCVVVVMLLASRFARHIQTAAIPVEVVDAAPNPSPQPPLARQLPTIPGNSTRVSPSTQSPPATRQPTAANSGQRSLSNPGQSSTPATTTTAPATPSPRSSPRPSQPSPTTPRPTTPVQTPIPNPNNRSGDRSPNRTPPTSPAPSPTTSSPPSSPTGDGDVTDRVSVSSDPPAPSILRTSVTITGLGSGQDVPEIPPQLKRANRDDKSGDFGCITTPESRRSFGQPITINVTIDEMGRVVPTDTRSLATASPDYAQLASCLINTWEFEPAADSVAGQRQPRWSNVIVTVIVNKAD